MPVTLDIARYLVLRDITLRGVYGRKLWDTWRLLSDLINVKGMDVTPLISHRLPLERYEEGMYDVTYSCNVIMLLC